MNLKKKVEINPQERIVHFLIDLLNASRPIEFSKYQDQELWGDERTFRRMRSLVNQVWERRNQTPLFEVVDSEGLPKQRGDGRYIKLKDKGITSARSERMAVMPAFLQMLQTLKGTILADEFQPLYSSWYADLNRAEKKHFDRTEKKFYCFNKGTKKYDSPERSEVVEEVYDALMKEQLVKVTFLRKGKEVTERLMPLTLVMFNTGLYLLCKFEDQKDEKIYSFALETFKEATSLRGTTFRYPVNFSPKQHFDGDFGFFRDDSSEFKVVLEYSRNSWVGPYLKGRRWTGNETYELHDDHERYSMTVTDLREVESWVLPLLSEAKVVSPDILRKSLKRKVVQIMEINFAEG